MGRTGNHPQPQRRPARRDALRRARAASDFRQRQSECPVRLRAHSRPDLALRLLAEQQRAAQRRHRRLRPARAGVHAGQQRVYLPGARGRTNRPARVHQLPPVWHLARLRFDLRARGTDRHRDGRLYPRRRAAERPGARQEPDLRVRRRLHPRSALVAGWGAGLCRLVPRQSEQQLPGHLRLQQPRGLRGRHADSLRPRVSATRISTSFTPAPGPTSRTICGSARASP